MRNGSPPGGVEGGDPVEVWGRRIGRALSILVGVAVVIFLYLAYVR